MELQKGRMYRTVRYECGGHNFKVWEAAGGGWWVDRCTEGGDTTRTMTLVDTLKQAEDFLKNEVATYVTFDEFAKGL